MKYTKTIVTACDHNYVWGAMLLGLSLRHYDTQAYYHVMGTNLTEYDIRCLESLPDTKVFCTDKIEKRSVCVQKPLAIATAETDLIIWMDSDCIITNNVDHFLIAPEGRFQIRFRQQKENAQVYRYLYQPGDSIGSIPRQVLDVWKRDVHDLDAPRITTVAQTNCFILTREHHPFIKLWGEQMDRVISVNTLGVYDTNSVGYSMTDESTINSLFAFSSQAPESAQYLLDTDQTAFLAHFGLQPKPWVHFTTQSMRYYKLIQTLLAWGKSKGFVMPPLPAAFNPANYCYEAARSLLLAMFRNVRYAISTHSRALTQKLYFILSKQTR